MLARFGGGVELGGLALILGIVVLALTGHCTATVGPFGIH